MKNFPMRFLLVGGWACIILACTTEIESVTPDYVVSNEDINTIRTLTNEEVYQLAVLFSEPMKALKLHDTTPIICSNLETRSKTTKL